ncbi:MAG: hypothetical protein ACWGQW_26135, partial [bacterium]
MSNRIGCHTSGSKGSFKLGSDTRHLPILHELCGTTKVRNNAVVLAVQLRGYLTRWAVDWEE